MTIEEALALYTTLITTPQQVRSGEESITNHDPSKIFDAIQIIAGMNVADENPSMGLRLTKLKPPGAG